MSLLLRKAWYSSESIGIFGGGLALNDTVVLAIVLVVPLLLLFVLVKEDDAIWGAKDDAVVVSVSDSSTSSWRKHWKAHSKALRFIILEDSSVVCSGKWANDDRTCGGCGRCYGCGGGVDLWFDDVIYGFWVYDWVFSRVCWWSVV